MPNNVVDFSMLLRQVRALQRQVAILQAGQAQLVTLDQFHAALDELDKQFGAMGDAIAAQVIAAIDERKA